MAKKRKIEEEDEEDERPTNPFVATLINQGKQFVLDRWNQNVAKVDVVPNPFEQKIEVIFYVHNLRVPEASRTIIQRRYPIVGEVIVRLEQHSEGEKKKKGEGDVIEGEYEAG